MTVFILLFLSWFFPHFKSQTFESQVGSVSWGYQQIAVFIAGASDLSIYYTQYDGSLWSQWTNMAGTSAPSGSGPTVCSESWGQLDMFMVGGSNYFYYHSYYNTKTGPAWVALHNVGTIAFSSGPICTSSGSGNLNLYGINTSNKMMGINKTNWNNWFQIDDFNFSASTPGAVSVLNTLYLFGRSKSTNNLVVNTWSPSQNWSSWTTINLLIYSGPAVISWDQTRIDVFYMGNTSQLIDAYNFLFGSAYGVEWHH